MVATLGDTRQRRALVTMVEPQYYGDGANVLLRPDFWGKTWADLRGQTLCAVQGALWNRPVSSLLLIELESFKGVRDAEMALHDGHCVGWLYDEVALRRHMAKPEFSNYRMPLETVMLLPWAVALPKREAGGRLDHMIGDLVAEWHRSGWLQQLEEKWKLPPSPFLRQAATQWSRIDDDGQFHCRRDAQGRWPLDCLDESLATSDSASGIAGMALRIRELTGLDISLLYDRYDARLFTRALLITVILCLSSLIGSLAIGLVAGWLIHRRTPVVRQALLGLTSLARMTPPLLQIYVVYFGIGSFLALRGLPLSAFGAALLVLSLYAGAANAVAFADAADVVARGKTRLRFKAEDALRAFRLSFATIMGSSVNLVKATGMASTIAVPELVHASTSIVADKGNASFMMNLLLVCYFVIVFTVVKAFEMLQRMMGQSKATET